MAFKAVLDACVLVPAALRDTLLRAAVAQLYQPAWSEMFLAEVEHALVRESMTTQDKARRLIEAIRLNFDGAIIPDGFEKLIPVMENDPDDRHVLAAAVYAQSQTIVTRNIRHFPAPVLSLFGVEAQTPDVFLTQLFDLEPDTMCEIIVAQASELRYGDLTVRDVLANVGHEAPRFAAQTWRRLLRVARFARAIEDLDDLDNGET